MIATAEKHMQKLTVFDNISLDGYFLDANGGGVLVFGRITHDPMASFWPTPMAAGNLPAVAEGMKHRRATSARKSDR